MTEDEVEISELDRAWIKSLLHPIRVAIVRQMLDRDTATPARLAEELELPLGVVGYHVRVLRDARVVTLVRRTQRRGALVHHYRLKDRETARGAMRRLGLSVGSASRRGVSLSDPWERLRRALAVLRALREEQGISRDALARNLRITTSQLASIERGETDPRFTVLIAMTHELGTTIGEVFTAAES